jgi:long-chain acyl-CoA synthetase
MLGYWNDIPTTETVLKDGWLRTGDMAAMDAEGFLFISGRRGDMIKTGAHRVAPMEIEEVIGELRGVAEVAVVGVEDAILGEVIKAVIRPEPDAELDEMRVKAHCRDRLATYKIPKFVAFVQEIPKTASGKVQRFLLSAH